VKVDAFATVEHVDDLDHQRVHLFVVTDALVCVPQWKRPQHDVRPLCHHHRERVGC
jgi:hypothetical protein